MWEDMCRIYDSERDRLIKTIYAATGNTDSISSYITVPSLEDIRIVAITNIDLSQLFI